MVDKKKKKMVITTLVCVLVFIAVGYALLTQAIKVGVEGTLNGVWDVYISDIKLKNSTGRAQELNPAYVSNKVNANFEVDLYMPGDSVEYEVTVKNDGNIDATLRTIATNATNTNEDIRFTHTIKQGEVLKKESETKFTFKIVFDERATTLPINSDPIEVTMKLDYLQNTGNSLYVPTNITTDNTCFSYNASGVITKYDYSCGNEVSIPESIDGVNIKSIANNAFVASDNTKPLQSINMENASYLTTFSFSDFINLKYATLPKTLVEIPQMAFFNCPLTTINLPGTVEKIGNYAFKGTSLSGSLYLPKSLKTIGVGAFDSLKLTGTLTIPDSVTTISNEAFYSNKFTKLVIGQNSSLTTIGNNAFRNNQISNAIALPKSVTTIGNNTFCNNSIPELALNYGLKSIGNYAFGTNKITGTINIPVTVEKIDAQAFKSNQIEAVIFNKNSALTTLGSYAFSNNKISNVIMIPKNLKVIQEFTFWSNIISGVTFEEGSQLKSIGKRAFQDNRDSNGATITGSLNIPPSVESIGFMAFKEALKNIDELNFGENSQLKTIYSAAFASSHIKKVTIPKSVTTMERNMSQGAAFESAGIEELIFEEGSQLETIDNAVFSQNSISKVVIPKSVKTINSSAFYRNRISSLTFEEGSQLTTIGNEAFNRNLLTNDGLGKLPSTLTTLATNAFMSNPSLTKITLTSPTDIDGWADGSTVDGKTVTYER
ncbi:MAG: leucine-rich repeat domain-containing protein [Bacilli bacterium]|nr:leucine-rich repeat domain-containing protein [Bacilli bacterium]